MMSCCITLHTHTLLCTHLPSSALNPVHTPMYNHQCQPLQPHTHPLVQLTHYTWPQVYCSTCPHPPQQCNHLLWLHSGSQRPVQQHSRQHTSPHLGPLRSRRCSLEVPSCQHHSQSLAQVLLCCSDVHPPADRGGATRPHPALVAGRGPHPHDLGDQL